MAAELKLVRVQEKGQVTLPADIRKRLGLKKGDYVAVEETPEGVLITTRAMAAIRALDAIGQALKEKGLTLEDMIESAIHFGFGRQDNPILHFRMMGDI